MASWLQSVLGKHVPCHSDLEFRRALQDGTILCSAANVVSQSANMQVRRVLEGNPGNPAVIALEVTVWCLSPLDAFHTLPTHIALLMSLSTVLYV